MIEAAAMRLTKLRKAIRNNRVSFPSQIPMFVRNAPGNLQRYSVQLYFLRGWNCGMIARRYGYSRFYIWRIVNEWKRHALSLGYLQAIPPADVLLELENALQRTLDRAGGLEQEAFKAYTDVASGISGVMADAELARPLEAWISSHGSAGRPKAMKTVWKAAFSPREASASPSPAGLKSRAD